MKKQILFIHGAGEGAFKEDMKLAESLRHALGDGYEIRYPAMENEADADYETWKSQIKKELATLNDNPILVGHSLGGSILLKLVSEEKLTKGIGGIFALAAPYWGRDGGWTYDGYETLMLPKVSDTKLPDDVPVFLFHSNDDEVVPFSHLTLFAKRFPHAIVRKLEGRGHQLKGDLSEVAGTIQRL